MLKGAAVPGMWSHVAPRARTLVYLVSVFDDGQLLLDRGWGRQSNNELTPTHTHVQVEELRFAAPEQQQPDSFSLLIRVDVIPSVPARTRNTVKLSGFILF